LFSAERFRSDTSEGAERRSELSGAPGWAVFSLNSQESRN
jgi:hypothetical protein